MSQPEWKTTEGSLGTYPAGLPISIQLRADPVLPATTVFYKLLSGNLPASLESDALYIDMDGLISGTPKNIASQETYTFTVRAYDDLNSITDRTFEIILSGSNNPKITLTSGKILTVADSVYIDYQITYNNPIKTNEVLFNISSGSLPPGLYLTSTGIIKGYPEILKLPDGSPATKTYTFSVQLKSVLGDDLNIYSITVINQQTSRPDNVRIPVILNSKPIKEPILSTDPLYDYYLLKSRNIPTINANEYFSFKIIGYDFDRNDIIYQYNGLPPGLVGDNVTGWITGIPTMNGKGITEYKLSISVAKKNRTMIVSPQEVYYLTVRNDIEEDIKFVTDSDLGIVFNGTISSLYIKATSALNLNYRIVLGSLPKNLILNEIGEIIGRISEQTETKITKEGRNNIYRFTVEAYSPDFPLMKKQKEFVLTINQYYPDPVENIYFKAMPELDGKILINKLLSNKTLIPTEYLYRPTDPYYGKAKDVSFVHAFGIRASTIEEYINAIQKNHYWRKIILGDIETAIATDSKGNVIYEVVYSKIVDGLTNNDGASVPGTIAWPKPINLRKGPWNINNTGININNGVIKTTLSPGTARYLHPGSLENMRNEVTANIKQNTDSRLLPKWMITQQAEGNTLGFVQAWVICYTKPGYSTTIKNLINTKWGHTLNEIEFIIDRYIIDKSATYDWNTNFAVPAWIGLPSASPVPDPMNSKDLSILFPRKTILPRDYE